MDGNELLTDIGSKHGAPMGRSDCYDRPTATVKLFRVRMVDGCYDAGGAYWGAGSPFYYWGAGSPLYAAIGDGFEWYRRAKDIEAARSALANAFPGLTIELPEVNPDFLDGYIAAALWSSLDDADDPLDANYQPDDIAPETLAAMTEDCRKFLSECGSLIVGKCDKQTSCSEMEYAGHDFWLTRNGHGAGFWDGDWETGDELTAACKRFRGVDLYVGDDGKIYA